MYEFDRMMEAYERETEATIRREAYWTANLMNATGNFETAITVEGLIGKSVDQKAKHDEDMEKLRQRAEQRKAERLKAREQRSGEHDR